MATHDARDHPPTPAPAPRPGESPAGATAGVWLFAGIGGLLLAVGLAGEILAWRQGSLGLVILASVYLIFLVVLGIFFARSWRRGRDSAREEDEARRDEAARTMVDESLCTVCERQAVEGLLGCSLCGRRVCSTCQCRDETDLVLERLYCPVCFEVGEPYRERLLELEISCDAKRERLEEEWRSVARRLADKGGRPDAKLLKRLDADLGERYREKIVALETALEEDRERLRGRWRAEAMRRLHQKAPESASCPMPGQELDTDEQRAVKDHEPADGE